MEHDQERPCLRVVPEHVAREHLGDRFDYFMKQRSEGEEKLRRFEAKLQEDEELQANLRRSPLPTLEEHGVVGPEDVVELQLGSRGWPDLPELDLPELFPRLCYWLCFWVYEWVCVWWRGRRFCFPRRRLVCRLICF